MSRFIIASTLAFFLSGLGGCQTTATITMATGEMHEVAIVRGEDETIDVQSVRGEGETLSLRRDEIIDIDHPGNVEAAVAFSLAVVTGGAGAAMMSSTFSGGEAGALELGVGLPLLLTGIAGLVYGGFGLSNWFDSKDAMRKPGEAPMLTPVAERLPDDTMRYGVELRWCF